MITFAPYATSIGDDAWHPRTLIVRKLPKHNMEGVSEEIGAIIENQIWRSRRCNL